MIRLSAHSTRAVFSFPLLALVAGSTLAAAEPPEAHFLWDQPFPLTGADHVVRSVDRVTTNGKGGWLARLHSGDPGPPSFGLDVVSVLWGSPTGGDGDFLWMETMIGPLYQTWINSSIGLSDAGQLIYRTWTETTPGGTDRLDTIWLDDEVLAIVEASHPTLPGYWRFLSEPGITSDGLCWWFGELSNTPGGPVTSGGLFLGPSAVPLLYAGDTLPNVPVPLDEIACEQKVHFSRFGSHWIASARMNLPEDENALVIDGAGVMIDGILLRPTNPVGPSAGAPPGSVWGFPLEYRIREDGSWLAFGGIVTPESGSIVTLLDTGVIRVKEGDFVDGHELSGHTARHLAINEAGDVAYDWQVWKDGGLDYAVFFNDRIVLRENDGIDVDGDGIADPIVLQWTGSIALSERDADGTVTVYVAAKTSVTWETPTNALLTFTVGPDGATDTPPRLVPGRGGIRAQPNPFAAETRFTLDAPPARGARLVVNDVTGRRVRRLLAGGGRTSVVWDGRDDRGERVASGVYFVRVEGDGSVTGRVVRRP